MSSHKVNSHPEYAPTLMSVRDGVHEELIRRRPRTFSVLYYAQDRHLAKLLRESTAYCTKDLDIIPADVLGSLAATRYKLLTSVSEHELVNIIARVICEQEVDESLVTEILFDTCAYFYAQRKLMRHIRLASLEKRLNHHPNAHGKMIDWIRQEQEKIFTADDTEEKEFFKAIGA